MYITCFPATSLGVILSLKKKWDAIHSRHTVNSMVKSYGKCCVILPNTILAIRSAAASPDKSSWVRLSLPLVKEYLIKESLAQSCQDHCRKGWKAAGWR